MKFEIQFLAAVLFLGVDVMVRFAAQGVEQAILSTAVEWSMGRIGKAHLRFFSKRAASTRWFQ